MFSRRLLSFSGLSVSLVSVVAGCSAASAGDDATPSESPLISDASSFTQRSDGRFDVRCRDGRTEIASAAQIQNGEVCNVPPVSDGITFTGPNDPLDPASCAGAPWTLGALESRLPGGALTAKLPATGAIRVVARSCSLRVTGAPSCSVWAETPRKDTLTDLWMELVETPSTQSGTASVSFQNTAAYTEHFSSCVNESGDLCPTSFDVRKVAFGISGVATVSASGSTPLVVRGYAGTEARDPLALLLSSSTWGTRASDRTFGWGGVSFNPLSTNVDGEIKSLISARVPASSSGSSVDASSFTTSCARIQVRSLPPAAGTPSWTESIAALVARY